MKQTTLVEQHVDRIRILESALRQRDSSLQKLSTELHSKDLHKSQLHASLDILRGGFFIYQGHICLNKYLW